MTRKVRSPRQPMPSATSTSTTYDAAGDPITVTTTLTTPSGVQTSSPPRPMTPPARVTSVTDSLGNVTTTQYDADG